MRKSLATILCAVSLAVTGVSAADLGVQEVIPNNGDVSTMDDLKTGSSIEADGFTLLPISFEYVDKIGSYKQGKHNPNSGNNYFSYDSGADAEYATLRVDIDNEKNKDADFAKDMDVTVYYEDIQYKGFVYQYNYDNTGKADTYVIYPDDNYAVGPMYTAHYLIGCVLPNKVVDSNKALRMEIEINKQTFIYNIRR